LNQIGVGPSDGFMIMDSTETWDAFIGTDPRLNTVKSYIHLSVKLIFDPPGTSYVLETMKQKLQEFEWRLNVNREGTAWVDPTPPPVTPPPPWW
jgi:hypothetical protein